MTSQKKRGSTDIGGEGWDGGFGDAAVLEVEVLEGRKRVEIKQQVIEPLIAHRVSTEGERFQI